MSNPVIPKLIEPYRLADKEQALSGEVPLNAFERLAERLVDTDGQVSVSLQFFRNEENMRILRATLSTQVNLSCERCLEPVAMPVAAEFEMALVMTEAQVSSVPSAYEAWVVTPNTQVTWMDLVEDELLLVIPQYAFHADTVCQIQTEFGDQESEQPEVEVASNPFDLLAQLKSQQED